DVRAAFQRALRLPYLRPQRLRRPAIGASALLAERIARPRLPLASPEQGPELASPLVRLVVTAVLRNQGSAAGRLVLAPASGVLADAVSAFVDLDDARYRPAE